MSTKDIFDARELRDVLGTFVTGVTIITTVDAEGKPYGLTANSFSSVSLDPPLVLWSQSLTAPSHPVFSTAERFCVSILAEDQVDVSNIFAKAGPNKFDAVTTHPGLGGVPVLEDCAATLECVRIASYPGGDHTVYLGRVERIGHHGRRPLAFGGGKYLLPRPHDLGAPPSAASAASIAELQAVRMATQEIVTLSEQLDETIGLGVWGNKGPTIVRWEEGSHRVSDNLRTGLVLPVLKSSTGLAFAAHLPRELVVAALEEEIGVAKLPEGAATAALDEMASRLASVREAGIVRLVACDAFTSLYGAQINAASVPVFDRHDRMVLALTAIGGVDHLDVSLDGPVLTAMREAGQRLSTKLGHGRVTSAQAA